MGLKVWLPFTDGTLKNQGYANITATGTNISSNNNGKLGKCCSFRDSTNFSYIMLSEAPFDNNTTEWSYACWFNPQDPGSNYHCLFSNRTVTSETGFAIFVGTASTYTGSILFDTGKRWSVAVSVPLNTWIHLALTYKRGVEKKLYVNGVLAGSTDDFSTIQTTANATNAVIGGSQSASTTVNANYMKGQLNDVRIYDHCLSAAEVKELAKGLVLHYKLDDVVNANIITNPNIVGSYVQDGITLTQEAGQLKCVTSSSSSNQRFYQGVSNVWTPLNSTFTVSFDAKGETDGISIDLNRSNYTGQDRALFTLSRDWKHYAGTIINSQNTAGGTLSIRCNTLGATFWIKNIKLERGAVETAYTDKGYITDSSGYGRHGTITGSPIAVGDTPRYLACVNFTSGQMVNTTVPLIGANPIFTVSFWIKMYSNTYTAWANVVWFSGTSYHIRMEVNNNTGKNLGWWNYPLGTTSGIGSGSVNYDEWNMMTMVWNGTNIITYKNGVQVASTALSGTAWNSDGIFTIGDTGIYMYMSDLRIYNTALSAVDIMELYRTNARVDNKGNIHAFEFHEQDEQVIQNNGVFEAEYVSELCPDLKYDKNVYVEPDGSKWVRIAHHADPTTSGLFSWSDDFSHGVYYNENKWYDIEQTVKRISVYEFMVKQKPTINDTEQKYRWIQTANPLTATWDDVKAANVTKITTSGYSNNSAAGGLLQASGSTRTRIANANSSNWFGAFGSCTVYSTNKIPGYPNSDISTGYMDLYVRIDNNNLNMGASFHKNGTINANQLIEI